jgi:hypothetical protein
MRFGRLVGPTIIAMCVWALPLIGQEPSNAFDFGLSKSFLQSLRNGHTIQPTFKMHADGHSALEGLTRSPGKVTTETTDALTAPHALGGVL